MKTSKFTIIEILDNARTTRDYDRLERLLYVFLTRNVDNEADIVQEALIAISRKMNGRPMMPNGRAIDVETIVWEFCQLEPMFVRGISLYGKELLC